jgi:hypothetical protein
MPFSVPSLAPGMGGIGTCLEHRGISRRYLRLREEATEGGQ